MNNLPFSSSQCVVWCWTRSYLCWICLNASHPEIFYTFSFVHQFYFWDSIIMRIIFPLLFFGFFLLLLFDHCLGFFFCFFFYDAFQSLLSMYSPSSCYTIKKAVSCTVSSISVSASRVSATGADIAFYNFEIAFLKSVPILYYMFSWEIFFKFYGQKKRLRTISISHYFVT